MQDHIYHQHVWISKSEDIVHVDIIIIVGQIPPQYWIVSYTYDPTPNTHPQPVKHTPLPLWQLNHKSLATLGAGGAPIGSNSVENGSYHTMDSSGPNSITCNHTWCYLQEQMEVLEFAVDFLLPRSQKLQPQRVWTEDLSALTLHVVPSKCTSDQHKHPTGRGICSYDFLKQPQRAAS